MKDRLMMRDTLPAPRLDDDGRQEIHILSIKVLNGGLPDDPIGLSADHDVASDEESFRDGDRKIRVRGVEPEARVSLCGIFSRWVEETEAQALLWPAVELRLRRQIAPHICEQRGRIDRPWSVE